MWACGLPGRSARQQRPCCQRARRFTGPTAAGLPQPPPLPDPAGQLLQGRRLLRAAQRQGGRQANMAKGDNSASPAAAAAAASVPPGTPSSAPAALTRDCLLLRLAGLVFRSGRWCTPAIPASAPTTTSRCCCSTAPPPCAPSWPCPTVCGGSFALARLAAAALARGSPGPAGKAARTVARPATPPDNPPPP